MNVLLIGAYIIVYGVTAIGVALAIYAASDLPRVCRKWKAKHGN